MTEAKIRIAVDELREPAIELRQLSGVDDSYTFYYDETNNDRSLHVTEKGLNVPNPGCFVLGGVVYRGVNPSMFDITELKKAVRLQPSAPELKLKHLGKGDFLQLLDEVRIGVFLDWLVKQSDLFVHYIALDPLYWATVDIIDSILANEDARELFAINRELKNDLFIILSTDIQDMATLFYRFEYPNVGRRRQEFLEKISYRVKRRCCNLPDLNYQMLKGALDIGRKAGSLPFLENEKPNIIIDSYDKLFLERICIFKNALHVFDIEETIRDRLSTYSFFDGEQQLNHYRFADSKSEAGVQVSDALVGLLGKMTTYASRSEPSQVRSDIKNLSERQKHALHQIKLLIDRSDKVSPAFFNNVISNQAIAIRNLILNVRP